ncbi:MAG TPA: LPXTG cell wall anchor domain-containing protein [Ilumatobacteraceae bacterium]
MTISKLIAASGIAAASLVGFAGVAHAAPTASAASVSCVTVDGLSDGSVVAPLEVNGTDAGVSSTVSCESPECAEGVLSVVTDDAGVQHEACVASAAEQPVVPTTTPHRASLASQTTSPVTPTSAPADLPKTGAGMGGVIIAAILVGTGSVASLLARRKS